jgi:[protein-PII] uridylyltransferase
LQERLRYKIEDLISKNADDFEISKEIKNSIKEYLESIGDIFKESQGKDFLVKHTKKIDEFITIAYKYILRKYFGDYLPFQSQIPIAITALGSYGREQLCIYSDIDIMIIYDETKGYNLDEIISSLLHIFWDAGLKLGHRTHKIEDIFEASKQDITIKTAMIEARFLCGSKITWMKADRELEKIRKYHQKEFILELREYNRQRYKKFQLNMEPNIKDGVGGLRDANSLFWIANILHNVKNTKELIPRYISDSEHKEFRMALEFLYRVRSALHLSSKRKNDTLNLQNIPEVAKLLGFKDSRFKSAQNQLIFHTLHSLWTIKTTSKLLIKKLTKSILFDKNNIKRLKNSYISNHLYICEHTVYTSLKRKGDTYISVLKQSLSLMDENLDFDISYINYLKKTKLTGKTSKEAYRLKKEFFYKKYLYATFYALYQANMLQEVFTPFRKVINLPQFDGYHKYPVDIHSIYALYHLENIEEDLIKELFVSLNTHEQALLRLVIFFHDAGKGRKKDHRIIGATILKHQAKKLNFPDKLIEMGATLVRYHTDMSNTASREDIYSEKVILSFVSKLKDKKLLKMLYILTYCDMKAVNPKIYSPFFASLLKELYFISLDAFEKEELIDETSRRLRKENALKKREDFKNLPKNLQKEILSINSNIFFIKHNSSQIIQISKWAKELQDKEYDYKIDTTSHLSITIIRKNELNLGYMLGKLSSLNVASMDIFKLFGGIKYFKIDFLENIDKDEIFYIKEIIENSFDMSRHISYKMPVIFEKELLFDCNHSKTYAKMALHTKDQKAIIAHIVSIFDSFGVDISTAKIQTIKHRTHNLFLIEKNGKFCDNLDKIRDKIIGKNKCAE